jgi:23S rRNA (guanosine2251-2'-O)-methyltransferase
VAAWALWGNAPGGAGKWGIRSACVSAASILRSARSILNCWMATARGAQAPCTRLGAAHDVQGAAGVADGRHWVYGLHAVLAVLERSPERILELMLGQARDDQRMGLLRERARQIGLRVQALTNDAIVKLVGDVVHLGAVAAVRPLPPLDESGLIARLDGLADDALLLVLDGVTDPHNLGACLRTADAAGAHALIIPRDRSASIDGAARKVAAGAAEFVPVASVTNLARTLDRLKERAIWVVGTDGSAEQSIHGADLKRPLALVLGAEGSGMRRLTRERCDFLVRIPMAGSVESLNVSVAAGVALFEARRQRG